MKKKITACMATIAITLSLISVPAESDAFNPINYVCKKGVSQYYHYSLCMNNWRKRNPSGYNKWVVLYNQNGQCKRPGTGSCTGSHSAHSKVDMTKSSMTKFGYNSSKDKCCSKGI